MPIHPRVTIREISEKAGVHFTTVSLALRKSPRLKAETRERIQKLAEEMGYRPDPMLSALNAYRLTRRPVHYQGSIAWINTWPIRGSLYENVEFNEYYLGACERAGQQGYTVDEFWLREPGMSIGRLHQILRARNVRGVLLPPQPASNNFLDLQYDEVSAVAFGYSMRPAVLNLVTNHQPHSMDLLFEKVVERGYRRIGLSIPRDWNRKVDCAFQSAMLLFQDENPKMPRIPILWDNFNKTELVAWMKAHRPDVVIGSNECAVNLKAAGFRIPGDVGYASLFLGKSEQQVSGIHQNDRIIGHRAVDLLIGMLHRGETGLPETPVRLLVEGEWIPGKTLPDRTAAAPKKAVKAKKMHPAPRRR